MIRQRETYWIDMGIPVGSEPGYMHPHVVSQMITVNKSELVEKIGTLSKKRVKEILNGINILLKPADLTLM